MGKTLPIGMILLWPYDCDLPTEGEDQPSGGVKTDALGGEDWPTEGEDRPTGGEGSED